MLAFARRGPSQFENREITELAQAELDLARRSVGADIPVTLRLGRRASVKVDVQKIELALINLCRNATDVSPKGAEVVLEAGAQNIEGVERGVLAVVDSGGDVRRSGARYPSGHSVSHHWRGAPDHRRSEWPQVLIVDDEVQLTRMIARALVAKGYRIQQCTSLALALAAFDKAPSWPDVVVFDINLGDGSGIDFLEHVRAVRSNIRYLAISGFVD